MKRISKLLTLIVILCLLPIVAPTQLDYAQATSEYNTPFLTDTELVAKDAMSLFCIRGFLATQGGYFKDVVQDVDGLPFDMALEVFNTAQKYNINPKVILATLQKEDKHITRLTRPSNTGMSNMTGCSWGDTARDQIACTGERFRAYQDAQEAGGTTPSGWGVGITKETVDHVMVTPATMAVAGQFTYTPYAGAQWGGDQPQWGGVYLFYDAWYNKFNFDSYTCGLPSKNVAIIDSVTVRSGGAFPTTTAGPTGSFTDFNFFILPRGNLNLAALDSGGVCGQTICDTVLLNVANPGMACNMNNLTLQQKTDLISFVNLGRKLIIYDSECVPQDYSWLPYSFTTSNPGQMGAHGTLTIVEENTLSSSNPASPYFIDSVMLGTQTDAVGDMNVMLTYDPNWYLDMSGTNILGVTGPVHTYASLPPGTNKGLIIYNGLDMDYMYGNPSPSSSTPGGNLAKIWLQELQQVFNPSDLPGTNPVVGIGLTPQSATLNLGEDHTVVATLTDMLGEPQPGILVTFNITSGPNNGAAGACSSNADCTTDINGQVSFSYTGTGGIGTDQIMGCFTNQTGQIICSQTVTVEWITPPCLIDEVNIDNSNSNGVVSGKVTGLTYCDAVLEVKNERSYWVNYELTSFGQVSITPAGGVNNLYDFNKLLPPGESVRYLVTFSGLNQSVTAFLDVTTTTSEAAKFMNLVQAEVDLISLLVPGFGTGFKIGIELYPELVNAFGAMPHLNNAGNALFSNPPNMTTFIKESLNAAKAGEFNTLGSTLAELGLEGAIEGFKLLAKRPGEALKVIQIILRNWGNVYNLLFSYPAGFVTFETR